MKKAIRILSMIVALVMCVSLCGCNMLDELRETRASITEEGNIKLYDGSEYVLLPECEFLAPDFTEFNQVYVVEEEIPLLLTQISDIVYLKSDDGLFLQEYYNEFGDFYCRSDVYEDIVERIDNGIGDGNYCYWYFDSQAEEFTPYVLTQAQAEAIATVCSSQEPEFLPEAATLDYEYMADLYYCSEDMLFQQDTVDVCVLNEKYYVASYALEGTALYSVPDELAEVFAQILEKRIENESYLLDNW